MLNSNSKGIRSRRGPLWVAAYCFNQLKKAQVLETDISSSIDKILQDEIDVVSYRVLAYLLLGVVRIYSKKVEYLCHDCNEVLVRLNKFVINTKDNGPVETLRMSVTIPERFELDAFDLDILEDAGEDHIAPQEEITLKEVLCKTEGFAQLYEDKFKEFDFGGNTSSADYIMVEDVCQLRPMNMDFEVFPSNSPINLLASKDIFQNSVFSQKESMNFDTVSVVEGTEKESVNLFGQDQQIDEDQAVQKVVPYEDEVQEKRGRISQEESMDSSIFSGGEKEPTVSVEEFNECHQVDNDHIVAKETPSSLCQMHQKIIEVNEARNFEENIERPQDDKAYRIECMDHGKSFVVKESLEELIALSVEEQDNKDKSEFQEKNSLEDGKLGAIAAESKKLDVTPQSKFQGGLVGRPKPGATTPEFISTPAVRESAHFSRKRKYAFDEMTVLPNGALRRSIHNASDLISNRRKFRRNFLAMQRESRISSLPDGFYNSLLPCYSSELQLLFSNKKMKIPDSLEIVETQGKLDVLESQTVGSSEYVETGPQTPPRCPDSLVIEETPQKLVVSESQSYCCPEHRETAPQTPPPSQNIKVRSMKHPERTKLQNSDRPSSPHASIEIEQSLGMNEVLNLMKEFNVDTLNSYGSLEREQCLTKDEDLNLMSEEIDSSETENSKLLAGWSERTRKVGRYLHKSFLDPRKQGEGDVVNFSQVLAGRVRKESARIFYEILVLKTTSYVDVKQNKAYGDIAIKKLPKLDQTFGIDDP